MKRRLFNLLAGLSLLLCAATGAFWVRACYWAADNFYGEYQQKVGDQWQITFLGL